MYKFELPPLMLSYFLASYVDRNAFEFRAPLKYSSDTPYPVIYHHFSRLRYAASYEVERIGRRIDFRQTQI